MVKPIEYRAEWCEAEAFLYLNKEHPAIIAAQQLVQKWIDAGMLLRTIPGRKFIIHLYDNGITPLQIIHEMIAISLFSYRNPSEIPLGIEYKVALAYSVLRLAGGIYKGTYDTSNGQTRRIAVRVPGMVRRKVGEFLFDRFYTFLKNAVDAIQEATAEQERIVMEMSKNFKAPDRTA